MCTLTGRCNGYTTPTVGTDEPKLTFGSASLITDLADDPGESKARPIWHTPHPRVRD